LNVTAGTLPAKREREREGERGKIERLKQIDNFIYRTGFGSIAQSGSKG